VRVVSHTFGWSCSAPTNVVGQALRWPYNTLVSQTLAVFRLLRVSRSGVIGHSFGWSCSAPANVVGHALWWSYSTLVSQAWVVVRLQKFSWVIVSRYVLEWSYSTLASQARVVVRLLRVLSGIRPRIGQSLLLALVPMCAMVEKLMCGNGWWHIGLCDTHNMRHVGMADNMSAWITGKRQSLCPRLVV